MATQLSADRNRAAKRALYAAARYTERPLTPLSNYSLSTVCPCCDGATLKRACKIRCERCGFMWDCSEL